MEPKQEIEQLTRELEHAGYLYYVLDNPEMSDYDYDHKLRRLEELEAQYPQYASPLSPTRRVGGQALMEGIMMRGPKKQAVVVRKPDGELEIQEKEIKLVRDRYPILGLPLIRGVATFCDSMYNGVTALMFSAEFVHFI